MTIDEFINDLKKLMVIWHEKDKENLRDDFENGRNAAYDCAAYIIEGKIEQFEKERREYREKVEADLREYAKKCGGDDEVDKPLSEEMQHLAEGLEDCFIGDTYSVKLDEEECCGTCHGSGKVEMPNANGSLTVKCKCKKDKEESNE